MAAATGGALLTSALIGGTASAYAAREGAKAQEAAADRAAGAQYAALDKFRELTDPFRTAGQEAITPLLARLGLSDTPIGETRSDRIFGEIQDDVTRRLLQSQATQGRLGSGSTQTRLAQSLAPLRLAQEQQDIANLFSLLGVGANAATGQATAGLNTAANVGQFNLAAGQAAAQEQEAIVGGIQDLVGIGALYGGGFFDRPGSVGIPVSGGGGGGGGYRPTVSLR